MSSEAARSLTWPLRITCVETAGIAREAEPVTLGVPLPQGLLHEASSVGLRDGRGADVPLQTEVLSHWDDGSMRWLLLDFVASAEAHGSAEYWLDASPSGGVAAHVGSARFPNVEFQVALEAADGRRHVGLVDQRSLRLGTNGRLRTSAAVDVGFVPPLGDVEVHLRSQVYSAQPEMGLELTVTNHRAEPLEIGSVVLVVALPGEPDGCACATADGSEGFAHDLTPDGEKRDVRDVMMHWFQEWPVAPGRVRWSSVTFAGRTHAPPA